MLPWFQFTVINLGFIPIRVWGLFVALGILVSLFLIKNRAKKLKMDLQSVLDHAFFCVLFGFIMARLFHIFFYEPMFYFRNPVEVFAIWHGGFSSFGGFVGGVIGFFWYAKRKHIGRVFFWKLGDIFAFSGVFGWIVGRVGCVMIHDHMGRPCNCLFSIQSPDGPRLEMAILEILFLLPLAVYFFLTRNQKRADGWYVSVVAVYYGLLRLILDFFRATDIPGADIRYFGLTPAQYVAIVMIIAGVNVWRAKKDGRIA